MEICQYTYFQQIGGIECNPVSVEITYGLERLATTDTYYPHLFVELGILGAVSYLIFIFTPLIKPISKKKWLTLIAIYLALLFDSLFSFALNNVAYLMLSIVLVYPIIVYEINKPKYSD